MECGMTQRGTDRGSWPDLLGVLWRAAQQRGGESAALPGKPNWSKLSVRYGPSGECRFLVNWTRPYRGFREQDSHSALNWRHWSARKLDCSEFAQGQIDRVARMCRDDNKLSKLRSEFEQAVKLDLNDPSTFQSSP
jgi:hypothetical protein